MRTAVKPQTPLTDLGGDSTSLFVGYRFGGYAFGCGTGGQRAIPPYSTFLEQGEHQQVKMQSFGLLLTGTAVMHLHILRQTLHCAGEPSVLIDR